MCNPIASRYLAKVELTKNLSSPAEYLEERRIFKENTKRIVLDLRKVYNGFVWMKKDYNVSVLYYVSSITTCNDFNDQPMNVCQLSFFKFHSFRSLLLTLVIESKKDRPDRPDNPS